MANLKQTIEFQAKGIAKLKSQYKELESRTKRLEGSTNRAGKSMGAFAAKLGLTTAALYGTMRAMSGVVSVGRQFEKNMSNVEAISGATGKELEALERNARELGSTSVFTASEIANLQVEFAKLGFSSKEIRGVTKDTAALASATGTDLATSAAVAGQTLRAFGLDVSQTSRVTDTMASSFSQSALDMDKFSNSMAYVAPIAKQVGVSVESTTAILGTLANAGISGSMAGTALRKILLEVGNESSKLSKRIGFPVESTKDLDRAFKQLNREGLSTAEMTDLVGQRAVSAFGILLDGVDNTVELTKSFKELEITAQGMADVQLDNLDGKITLLNSAMEGLGLRMFELVEGPLTSMVVGLTDIAGEIDANTVKSMLSFATGLGGVIGAIKLYNGAMLLAKYRTVAFNAVFVKTPWGAVAVAIGLLAGAVFKLVGVFDNIGKDVEGTSDKLDSHKKAVDSVKKSYDNLKASDIDDLWEKMHNMSDEEIWKWADEGGKKTEEASEATKKLDDELAEYNKTFDEWLATQKEAVKAKEQEILFNEVLIENYPEMAESLGLLKDKTEELTMSEQKRASIMEEFRTKQTESIEGTFAKEIELLEKRRDLYIQAGADQTEADKMFEKQKMDLYMKTAQTQISGFASSMQAMADAGMVSEKTAKRVAQVQALVDAYASANAAYKAMAGIPVVGPALAVVAAGAAIGAGLANVKMIEQAETGFEGVVSQPTMFMTGEGNKREHVAVTPLEGPNINGPQGGGVVNVNISGGVVDESYVRNELIPALNKQAPWMLS
tara:strand:- start:1779 stop:4127 length:2349 start_codon:yes stop_codon:yes gene_type:complete